MKNFIGSIIYFSAVIIAAISIHIGFIVSVITLLVIGGAYYFIMATIKEKQRKLEIDNILTEIETRDLRMATRWEGR